MKSILIICISLLFQGLSISAGESVNLFLLDEETPQKFPNSTNVQMSGSTYFAWDAGPVKCQCYCGVYLDPPCSEDACKRACGWVEPSPPRPQQPSYDYQDQQRRLEEERRRREEAERKERQLKEAEEEAKRIAEEAERDFQEQKKKALESLKGTGGEEIQIKSGTDIFGIKGSPDVILKKQPEGQQTPITTAWKQLHCSASISFYVIKVAEKVAEKGNIEEVRYLAEQAMNALSGAPVGVECPPVSPPPSPYNRTRLDPSLPEVKFYKSLLKAVEKQAERIDKAEKQILKETAKKKELHGKIEEKEKDVARLKKEIEKIEKTPPAPKLEDKDKEKAAKDEIEAKKRAIAEAREILEKAKEEKAQVDKLIQAVDRLIQAAEKEKADATSKLNQYEGMFNVVKSDPNRASEFLGMIER